MDALRFSRAARAHLEEEERVLARLVDCLEEERRALVALDGAAVAEAVARKEAIAAHEQTLARARRGLIADAAALVSEASGGSAVDLSLGEIVERLRPPAARELLALRERVRHLARQAQRMNLVNRQLCLHALSCVRGYLDLTGRSPAAETYGAGGRLVASAGAASAYARRA
jgi:flagellar biosynthesis/type III secretory pathway chaperone